MWAYIGIAEFSKLCALDTIETTNGIQYRRVISRNTPASKIHINRAHEKNRGGKPQTFIYINTGYLALDSKESIGLPLERRIDIGRTAADCKHLNAGFSYLHETHGASALDWTAGGSTPVYRRQSRGTDGCH